MASASSVLEALREVPGGPGADGAPHQHDGRRGEAVDTHQVVVHDLGRDVVMIMW